MRTTNKHLFEDGQHDSDIKKISIRIKFIQKRDKILRKQMSHIILVPSHA